METKEPDSCNEKKIIIEVKKHDFLLKILQDRKQTWRIMTGLAIITLIFFLGLGIAVTILRTFYPYSSIQTTKYGSTIIKNDNKEVIYWLFNTAELWANSGIKVKKGDVITIRSSGSAHTAIHHLVDNSRDNVRQRMDWVKTEGITNETAPRDRLRKQHRIFSNMPTGALIMQVIPDNINLHEMMLEEASNKVHKADNTTLSKNIDKQLVKTVYNSTRFYYIGAERSNIKISEDGILHFAVNDIVLTHDIINRMMANNLYEILTNGKYVDNTIKSDETSVLKKAQAKFKDISFDKPEEEKLKLCASAFTKTETKDISDIKPITESIKDIDISKIAYSFGRSEGISKATLFQNEMTYYKDSLYRNAWYDDNIGSFLIIIEKDGKQ